MRQLFPLAWLLLALTTLMLAPAFGRDGAAASLAGFPHLPFVA